MANFYLGLTLSGGATAGAYTAGVMDFFLEALNEWENAKKAGSSALPTWSVKLDNLSSASAGSIVSYLTAASICAKHDPVPHDHRFDAPVPKNNLLYEGWVLKLDQEMFSTSDLPDFSKGFKEDDEAILVRSVLNSNYMHDLAKDLLQERNINAPVPQWANEMRLQFSVTNNRGVPYALQMEHSLNPVDNEFNMLRHADYIAFSTREEGDDDAFSLDLRKDCTCENWKNALSVASSSSGIPGVFPSQVLSRPRSQYDAIIGGAGLTKPSWGKGFEEDYKFNATDGGFFNNEPIALCRGSMERSNNRKLSGSSKDCWGACILVDCNSNSKSLVNPSADVQPFSIMQALSDTISTAITEASFKDHELASAVDPSCISQYILSPTREGATEEQGALAGMHLGLFAGLLHMRLRHHDFMLGRNNAQRFLRETFVVKIDDVSENPLFKGVSEYARGRIVVPIVPLLGTAEAHCATPEWPRFSRKEKDEIVTKFSLRMRTRTFAVLSALARNMGLLSATRWWNLAKKIQNRLVWFGISRVADYLHAKTKSLVYDTMNAFK